MVNISHFKLGSTPIANIFMCLSSRDKPLSVFAYYVCFVQVLHVLSANRCTWGWQRKRHLLVNVHTNALWCFFLFFFMYLEEIGASQVQELRWRVFTVMAVLRGAAVAVGTHTRKQTEAHTAQTLASLSPLCIHMHSHKCTQRKAVVKAENTHTGTHINTWSRMKMDARR